MSTAKLTPKVHPLTRGIEADDPMELMAEAAPGDPDVMFECIVSEFAWMGWSTDELIRLFHEPGYPVLNQLLELFGEVEVRRRLEQLVAGVGVFRVSEVIDDEPEPQEPELIELNIRGSAESRRLGEACAN
jgi:hypothetical protein